MHKAVMVILTHVSITSPVYRKLPMHHLAEASEHWMLPCCSHWKIQVLERASHLFYVANCPPTERDSQLQTRGSTWGMWSQQPYRQENRTKPWLMDSWTVSRHGMGSGLSCDNYYRQWIGRRGRGIKKNTIKHSKWEECGLNAKQCWKYLIHRLVVIKLRENVKVTCSFPVSQERKVQWLTGGGGGLQNSCLLSAHQ